MAWDSNLDPQSPAYQIAADNSRYIRVLAGPGTGKSFALKRRVARLLESRATPARILAVTFTKVAAEDLHRELINMGVPGCEQIGGSTLHSLGMRVLSLQNVLAVGDDDQSLYSFKHAHPEGIRTFARTHSDCAHHALLDCYRCPTGVVAIANALIGHNVDREPIQLTPIPANGPGEMWIAQYPDVTHEAQAIAAFVDGQINTHGRHPGEILILA
jgi:superfamily I DNA/RNA helicase